MVRISAGERREELIKALVRVVARAGIEGATTRQIAKEAGMTLAALHYCFESKEELLAASYDHLIDLLCALDITIEAGSGVNCAAYVILEKMISWYETEEGYSKTQLELFFWVCRHDRDRATGSYRRALTYIEDLLLCAARLDDDRMKIPSMARFLAAAIDGIIAQHVLTPNNRAPIRETVELVHKLLQLPEN